MKFRVIAGKHRHIDSSGKATVYSKGDEFECDRDLVKAFKNKFKRVDPFAGEEGDQKIRESLKAVPIGDDEWDVVNEETDERVNEQPLSEHDAKVMAYGPEAVAKPEKVESIEESDEKREVEKKKVKSVRTKRKGK